MDSSTILAETLSDSFPPKREKPKKYISGAISLVIILLFWPLIKCIKIKTKDRTVFMYACVFLLTNIGIFFHTFPVSITIYTLATYFSVALAEFFIIFRTSEERTIKSILSQCFHMNRAYLYDTKDNPENLKPNLCFISILTLGILLCLILSLVSPVTFLTSYAIYCLILFLLLILCRAAELAYYYRARILEPMQKLQEDLICQTQGDARDLVQEFLDDWYSKEPSPERAAFFYAEYMQAILLLYSLSCGVPFLKVSSSGNVLGSGGSALVDWRNFFIVLLVFAGVGIYGFLLKMAIKFEVRRANKYIIELGFGEDNKGLRTEYDFWYSHLTPFFKM